ncbi:MAG: Lrp/AsnC family transcriptional regulator [Pseudomonadota bacterium]
MALDKIDIKIIETLQRYGRLTNQRLAEHVNLSPSACLERHKKLDQEGYIRGYLADIDFEKITPHSTIMVEITLKKHHSEDFQRFENVVIKLPEIIECYAVGGGIDYIVKFISHDINHYQQMMDQLLNSNAGIDRYFTYFVTRQIKKTPYPVDRFFDSA